MGNYKEDGLPFWVKWVHSYYLETTFVETNLIPGDDTGVIRKIIKDRKYILSTYALQRGLRDRLQTMVLANRFNIKKLYITLRPEYLRSRGKS